MSIKELLTIATVSTIGIKTDSVDFTNNKLIAVTAAGTLYGTYVSESLKESLKNDTDYLVFENIRRITVEKSDATTTFILLKDATLISGDGTKSDFKFLYLFVEDIIALSIGNASFN